MRVDGSLNTVAISFPDRAFAYFSGWASISLAQAKSDSRKETLIASVECSPSIVGNIVIAMVAYDATAIRITVRLQLRPIFQTKLFQSRRNAAGRTACRAQLLLPAIEDIALFFLACHSGLGTARHCDS